MGPLTSRPDPRCRKAWKHSPSEPVSGFAMAVTGNRQRQFPPALAGERRVGARTSSSLRRTAIIARRPWFSPSVWRIPTGRRSPDSTRCRTTATSVRSRATRITGSSSWANRIQVLRSRPDCRELSMAVDDVIAATGFVSPLRDLPALGVATFGQSHLPAQSPFWESATVPGIFFAGTLNQGSPGLKKHGIPSNSGAVQGYRYNARVLARHLAETRFGVRIPRPQLQPAETVRFLLNELSHGPELWHQRSYLARVVHLDRERGISDEGILPLS